MLDFGDAFSCDIGGINHPCILSISLDGVPVPTPFDTTAGNNPIDTDLFFGVIDTDVAFSSVTFSHTGGDDGVAYDRLQFGSVTVAPVPLNVTIDIKPGSDPNCFNNDGKGVIPVAILTTSIADGDAFDFDATTVDPGTLELDTMLVAVKGQDKIMCHEEDVDGDGDLDLVCQIEDVDNIYTVGSDTGTVIGSTFDGQAIEGTDSICVTQ